ncbi:UNVERIFIED_CONTAM: hypothetical protein GTU68_027414 [Idotea baltica]|nr:hypothetical protein [Idotea baltica]
MMLPGYQAYPPRPLVASSMEMAPSKKPLKNP